MRLADERELGEAEVLDLYSSVGWSAYTRDSGRLVRALAASHLVLTARDDSGMLIGLARTVSDGETVCCLQDLLVHPSRQRQGVGSALLRETLLIYRDCRTFVLTTDDDGSPSASVANTFYRQHGLLPHAERGLVAYSRV